MIFPMEMPFVNCSWHINYFDDVTVSVAWETSGLEVERKGDCVTSREKSDFKLHFVWFILR